MNAGMMPSTAMRYRDGNPGTGGGYEQYAAGLKRYGASGRAAPNIGAVRDKAGYAQRDRMEQVRKRTTLNNIRGAYQRQFPQM